MMLQGVAAYSTALVPLAFYSWFGNKLTEEVRNATDGLIRALNYTCYVNRHRGQYGWDLQASFDDILLPKIQQ
jgi:hypothetical protein